MKRLQPLSIIAVNNNEVRLRCKPKFDSLSPEELRDLISIRARSNNAEANTDAIEAEFPFQYSETGALLQDAQFILLTADDYSELWISSSVDNFSLAYEKGVNDPSGGQLTPIELRVGVSNDSQTRSYNVAFVNQSSPEKKEFEFTVCGVSENKRTVEWTYGKYSAIWKDKKWCSSHQCLRISRRC